MKRTKDTFKYVLNLNLYTVSKFKIVTKCSLVVRKSIVTRLFCLTATSEIRTEHQRENAGGMLVDTSASELASVSMRIVIFQE